MYAASEEFEGIDADGQNAVCVVGTCEDIEEPVSVKWHDTTGRHLSLPTSEHSIYTMQYEMIVLLEDGDDGVEPYEVGVEYWISIFILHEG